MGFEPTLHPLHELLQKDHRWEWTGNCEKAFSDCKQKLLNSRLLIHYDADKPLTLACDASSYGVGAVISHTDSNGQERPIAFASRTLSSSEKNYAQLECEALSIIFGVKKFHQYLYGRKFTLETDHKPLTTILGPHTAVPTLAAARLQRWALILSAYSYDIVYRRSEDHANADAMSRCPSDSEPTDQDIHYFSYLEDLPITSNKLAEATRNDITVARVYDFTVNGWPDAVNQPDLQPFVRRKNELTTEGGCLLWGRRIIIPNKYRQQLLDDLHEVHPGMCRMKSLARSYLWWPSLDQVIEEKVRNCQTCMSLRNSPPLSPLKPWTWPKNPWQRIHIDFAEFQKQQFLIVIDSHSKWIEVFPMRSTTSFKTIETLRSLFASYGLPEDVVSDNGPQFTSKEFKDFLKNNGVRQILTPPYHPASNGVAERSVQIVKQSLMKQVMHGNRNQTLQHRLDNFLLTYRITQHTVTGYAPCELFLKRVIRNRFTLLKPNLAKSVEEKQNLQKIGHDVKTSTRSFQEGQIVSVKNFRGDKRRWIPGRITCKLGDNTFLVRTGGRTRYCHIDHLLPNVETETSNLDSQNSVSSNSRLNDADLDFPVYPIPEVQPNRNDQVNLPVQDRRYPVRIRQAPDKLDL